MTEADHDFLCFHAATDIGFRFVGRLITRLNIERSFIRAAVLRAAQRADAAGNRRVHVRARAGDHTTRERRCVEFVLGVKNQRRVHCIDP